MSTTPATTDRELCDLVLYHDDQQAFAVIMKRYRGLVYTICLDQIGNAADADECASYCFLVLYRYLPRFQWRCSLKSMLHMIARAKARNYRQINLRYQRKYGTRSLDEPIAGLEGEKGSGSGVFGDLIEDVPQTDWAMFEELTTVIDTATKALNPRQREILRLREEESKSYEEVAAALGMRCGTVKSAIARIRDVMSKQALRHNPDLAPHLHRVAVSA